jgi:hypothetical protein
VTAERVSHGKQLPSDGVISTAVAGCYAEVVHQAVTSAEVRIKGVEVGVVHESLDGGPPWCSGARGWARGASVVLGSAGNEARLERRLRARAWASTGAPKFRKKGRN